MFGQVVAGEMKLSDYGRIVENELKRIARLRKIEIVSYVVMPNHVYFIVALHGSQSVGAPRSKQEIPLLLREFKATVTQKLGFSLWQRSYFDNIIEDAQSLEVIKRYINNNPTTWKKDKFYCTNNL